MPNGLVLVLKHPTNVDNDVVGERVVGNLVGTAVGMYDVRYTAMRCLQKKSLLRTVHASGDCKFKG